MIYEKYEGQDLEVEIKNTDRENVFQKIGDKAFLSNKSVRRLVLPDTVETIGNWAFAHMQQLTTLVVPARALTLGKQCFLDCPNLSAVYVSEDTSENPGTPFFLATTVGSLQESTLFAPDRIGNGQNHERYMQEYDEAVIRFVESDDEKGFEPFFLGWFNDEDTDSVQKPRYIQKRRREKMELTMLRLRYPMYLSEENGRTLTAYLEKHFDDVFWEMLPEKYGKEVVYMEILDKAGLLTAENRRKMVEYLAPGEPEVVAYLLRREGSEEDVFSGFDL